MISEETLEIAKAVASEFRQRGASERADAIEALVAAAQPEAAPSSESPPMSEVPDLFAATGPVIRDWVNSGRYAAYRVGKLPVPREVVEEYVRPARESLDLEEVSDEEAARLVAEGRSRTG
jgi:hypothetical protein